MIYLQNGGGVLNGGLNFEWPWPADLHFGVLYFEMTLTFNYESYFLQTYNACYFT